MQHAEIIQTITKYVKQPVDLIIIGIYILLFKTNLNNLSYLCIKEE